MSETQEVTEGVVKRVYRVKESQAILDDWLEALDAGDVRCSDMASFIRENSHAFVKNQEDFDRRYEEGFIAGRQAAVAYIEKQMLITLRNYRFHPEIAR